jgi:hypothetical protein
VRCTDPIGFVATRLGVSLTLMCNGLDGSKWPGRAMSTAGQEAAIRGQAAVLLRQAHDAFWPGRALPPRPRSVRYRRHSGLIANIGNPTLSTPSGRRQSKLFALRDASFDHLVGNGKQPRRHLDAERARGLQLMTNSNLVGCITGQVGGFLALEDAAGVDADLLK